MQVQESHYIWPPRPKHAIPFEDAKELYSDLGWIAQLKYNDTRLLIKYLENGQIELWNRHAEKLRSYTAPDWLLQQLEDVKETLNITGYCLLDGGLLDQKHRAIKDTIVIWDILVKNGEHLLNTTYQERYDILWPRDTTKDRDWWDWEAHAWHWKDNLFNNEEFPFGEYLNTNIFMPRLIYPQHWDAAWDMIQRINKPFIEADPPVGPLLEGFVFKDPNGRLEMGWQEKNNDTWSARSRVATGRHAF